MKKILILFLSILVISCSSGGVNAGLGDRESMLSDSLNFSLSDTQLGNDKAGFDAFEIRDGAVVGKDGSDTVVYFTAPTLRADISATEISQLEIMTALDEAFSTAITNQPSLRAKLAPNAVSVVVVEMDYATPPATTATTATTATVVVRLFAAEGYKFSSSISRSSARSGVGNTVKDIIIKVATGTGDKTARIAPTTKIGLVAITEFDYYLAPTTTTAGVEYAKIDLADFSTFKNLVIIPPKGSKYVVGRTTVDKAIKSFISNATIHGTNISLDGTVKGENTFTVANTLKGNADPKKHELTLTITKTADYDLPKTDTTYSLNVESTLSFGEFVKGIVITDTLIDTIKFEDQDITGTAILKASGFNLATGAVTVTSTDNEVVLLDKVKTAVEKAITDSTDTASIGIDNFTVGELKLSGTKKMSTTVTITVLGGYAFDSSKDNKDNKIIDITITAKDSVTFHDGKVNEATLITDLNKIANDFNTQSIGSAKFSGAGMTAKDGFTATITGAAGTELTKEQITSGVRNLLADVNPPTGIVNEDIVLNGANIDTDGKFTATVTFNIDTANGYSKGTAVAKTWGAYSVTFTAEGVTFK